MTWLATLLIALTGLTRCERLLEAVRRYLHVILEALVDPETGGLWDRDHDELRLIDQHLARVEEILRACIGVRVCELAARPKSLCRRPGPGRTEAAPTAQSLHRRLAHAAYLLATFEQRAVRRFAALSDPLRLDAAHRSTSPGFAGGGNSRDRCFLASTAYAGEVACARLRVQDRGGLAIRAPP